MEAKIAAQREASKSAPTPASVPTQSTKEEVKKGGEQEKKEEPIGFKKEILKKVLCEFTKQQPVSILLTSLWGDGSTYPKKGDTVSVRYKGTFTDGKV